MNHRGVRRLGIILCVLFMPAGARPAPADAAADEERLVRIQQSIQSGDLRGARSELQEALTRLPKEPRIYNLLGVIDAQEKHFTAAEMNFRHAIQLAPQFTGAYLNLGRLYQENVNQQVAAQQARKIRPIARASGAATSGGAAACAGAGAERC